LPPPPVAASKYLHITYYVYSLFYGLVLFFNILALPLPSILKLGYVTDCM